VIGALRITVCQRRLANGELERPEVPAVLRAAGHHVRELDDGPLDWTGDDLLWMQGNANWYPLITARLAAAGRRRPRVVLWHTEPLPPPPTSGLPRPRLSLREIAKIALRDRRATDVYTNAARLRRLARAGLPDVLVVSARIRQDYLTGLGIASHFVPLGYDPGCHGRDLGLERDIDVLFLGTMQVPRRRRLVAGLRRAGVEVRTAGSWEGRDAWGDARTTLLNRTKILLNLPRHPGELAGLRMLLGMANGAMVVSEPIVDPEPYVPDRHYVEAPPALLPGVVRHYLAHPDQRGRVAGEARCFVTTELTMQRSVGRILALVTGDAPVPAAAERGG